MGADVRDLIQQSMDENDAYASHLVDVGEQHIVEKLSEDRYKAAMAWTQIGPLEVVQPVGKIGGVFEALVGCKYAKQIIVQFDSRWMPTPWGPSLPSVIYLNVTRGSLMARSTLGSAVRYYSGVASLNFGPDRSIGGTVNCRTGDVNFDVGGVVKDYTTVDPDDN